MISPTNIHWRSARGPQTSGRSRELVDRFQRHFGRFEGNQPLGFFVLDRFAAFDREEKVFGEALLDDLLGLFLRETIKAAKGSTSGTNTRSAIGIFNCVAKGPCFRILRDQRTKPVLAVAAPKIDMSAALENRHFEESKIRNVGFLTTISSPGALRCRTNSRCPRSNLS